VVIVPAPRRYDDPCGIARALNVIGDRWALLVVRELIFGPKRFLQLRTGLHDISPNVLAHRLRDLQDAGVVRQEMLDPPASVAVYELTSRGRALESVLLELGRWGSREPVTAATELSVNALLLALKTVFNPAVLDPAGFEPASGSWLYALRIDGERFGVSVAGTAIEIARGRPEHAAATFETDVATLRAVAFGREPISRAEEEGRLTITGDRSAAKRVPRLFAVPDARSDARRGAPNVGDKLTGA
jgi:DNA-binding HxlR family transcriptional regulator